MNIFKGNTDSMIFSKQKKKKEIVLNFPTLAVILVK
jgi:hypothetical protein